MKLVTKDGRAVMPGDKFLDFRGEKTFVVQGWKVPQGNSGGKISVTEVGSEYTREVYPTVLGLEFRAND